MRKANRNGEAPVAKGLHRKGHGLPVLVPHRFVETDHHGGPRPIGVFEHDFVLNNRACLGLQATPKAQARIGFSVTQVDIWAEHAVPVADSTDQALADHRAQKGVGCVGAVVKAGALPAVTIAGGVLGADSPHGTGGGAPSVGVVGCDLLEGLLPTNQFLGFAAVFGFVAISAGAGVGEMRAVSGDTALAASVITSLLFDASSA